MRIRKTVTRIVCAAMLLSTLIPSLTPRAASKHEGYAYLYFYTIDADEIDSLSKKVKAGRNFTFPDPNDYKYTVYKDGDGNVIKGENDDLYDSVTGIEWWDETDTDHIEKYAGGKTASFDAGTYYFRVHTDDPAITGENILISSKEDMVYLSFYDADGNAITDSGDFKYDTEITNKDTFTFPDPAETCSNGIYWACTDYNKTTEKQYLFKAGEKVKFSAGEYEFHIATSDPVTITYHYPLGDITSSGHDPGDIYGSEMTGKVGESITLYKSPGSVVWGADFAGWEDDSGNGKVYSGGSSYKIMDNGNISLTMVYEENENWDPFAKDENGDAASKKLMRTSEEVNSTGGTAFATYIDANGNLANKVVPTPVNSKNNSKGARKTIEEREENSSLKDGGDPTDPGDYTKDMYGNDMEDSPIENPGMGDVLRQNNSAHYMDIYGNSIMWHDDLSRIDDMCVAWIRLYINKNSDTSFATLIEDWDDEEIDRYEAIEFGLLSCKEGEYPGDANSTYKRWNSNDKDVVAAKKKGEEFGLTTDAKLPEWKDSYMSRSAFKKIQYTKQIFTGWCDTYDDGVYEAYSGDGSGIQVVADAKPSLSFGEIAENLMASAKESVKDLFVVTAYAETSSLATAKQYGTYITQGLDSENQIFRRQFLDKDLINLYGTYSFGALSGLEADSIANLTQIYNYLTTECGFSEAMAAGACGNLWQESNFKPTALSHTGKYFGIVQWGDGRRTALNTYAANHGGKPENLDMQLGYLKKELDGGYKNRMDVYLQTYGGGSTASVEDPALAADAWCVVFEGCTCGSHDHSIYCAVAKNGKSYQDLALRKARAEQVADAVISLSGEGVNTKLVVYAKSFLGTPYVWGGTSPAGFDCSGFARYICNNFGANISGTSAVLAATAGTDVEVNPSKMLPGDLVFYTGRGGNVNHVAIYIGGGYIIGANGSPTKKDSSNNYVLGAQGEGSVTIKEYNYRTPYKVKRVFSAANADVYEVIDGGDEDTDTDVDTPEENTPATGSKDEAG